MINSINYKFLFFLAYIFCINVSCNKKKNYSDEILKNLHQEGWTQVDSLYDGSTTWRRANSSYREWNVMIRDGKLRVYDSVRSKKTIYKFNVGNFEGLDLGEFGGKLIFYPKDSIQKGKIIFEGNIVAMFELNNQIYALEGLDHGLSKGRILKLIKNNNLFICETFLNLNDCPYAYTFSKDKELFIVTSRNLIKIKNDSIKIIIDNAFWDGLYPNSIILNEGTAIIGMRGLISIVDINSKKILNFKK